MTAQFDPPVPLLRSLPLAILLGTAVSAVVMPFLRWFGMWISGGVPVPPGAVWVEYLAIKAVAGACAGAGMYAAGRLPPGWLRMCLCWILFWVLIEGDADDFARWSP